MTTKPPVLIVAVEPDANQAKQLASMAKRYLRAEFVVESTAAAALEALRDRVPDLILTPVLLSSRDEMLLTEHLRHLGAAAAHVQTLAIPILSSAEPTMRERGSRLIRRRQRPEPEDAGCDLSVFADQVKIYLERAAGEQQARADITPDAPVVAETPIVPETPTIAEAPVEEPAASVDKPSAAVGRVLWDPPVTPGIPPSNLVLLEEDAYEEWLPVELSAEPAPEPPLPPVTPADPAQARALEEELGLIAPPGHTPQLWRVAVGLTDDTPVVEEPARVAPAPAIVAATPMRRRPRAHKPSPPLDDWAYFDPTQSGFKALIRRLDEIAAQYVST